MKPKQSIIIALLLLALAACTNEPGQLPEPQRDPITLASRLDVIVRQTTRQASEDFFRDKDVVRVTAGPLNSSGTLYETYYTYSEADGEWNLCDGYQHIYLQDVYDADAGTPTHNFWVDFLPGLPGWSADAVLDQSTPAALHSADEVSGELELHATSRTLQAKDPLERLSTKLTIQIAPGEGWGGNLSLPAYLQTCDAEIYRQLEVEADVTPYFASDQPTAGDATYTAILPPNQIPVMKDRAILRLTGKQPGAKTHTLRLDEDITPLAGHEVIVTAELPVGGELRVLNVVIAPWTDIDYDEGNIHPALTPEAIEAQRLMAWAIRVRGEGAWDEDFTLACDVNLTGYPWEPVGDADDLNETWRYTGTFDGGNHTISGLTPYSADAHFAFFGTIGAGGRVQNLTLAGTGITQSAGDVAGIAVHNYGEIEDCELAADVHLQTAGNGPAAGIAVYNHGKLTGCHTAATVTGGYAGGIAYSNSGADALITQCRYTGSAVEATGANGSAGGIVAQNSDNATVQGCTVGTPIDNSVSITSPSDAGGIVGVNAAHISGCTAYTHTLDSGGNGNAGGIAGSNGTAATLTGCYSQAETLTGSTAGGITGNNRGTVAACHTGPGQITAIGYAGGIAGRNQENGILAACYSLATGIQTTDANRTVYAGGITGFNNQNATHLSCHWLAGSDVPTRGIGRNINYAWDEATEAFSYPFATVAAFYANGPGSINLMVEMNRALDGLPSPPDVEWERASESAYPTLKKK